MEVTGLKGLGYAELKASSPGTLTATEERLDIFERLDHNNDEFLSKSEYESAEDHHRR